MKSYKTIIATVELEIEEPIFSEEPIDSLIGELISVKSGIFENSVYGTITDVKLMR